MSIICVYEYFQKQKWQTQSNTPFDPERLLVDIGMAPLGCNSAASNEMDLRDTQNISHNRSFNNSLWAFKLTTLERSESEELDGTPKPLSFTAKVLYWLLVWITNFSIGVDHFINTHSPQKKNTSKISF